MKSTADVSSPVWHRMATEMARDGYSAREIAEEFGCGADEAQGFVDECGPEDRRRSKVHAERMRRLHADPEFAAAHAERSRKRMLRLNADQEFAAAHADRMRRQRADPAFAAKLGRLPKGLPKALAGEYRALRAKIGREAALRQLLNDGGAA